MSLFIDGKCNCCDSFCPTHLGRMHCIHKGTKPKKIGGLIIYLCPACSKIYDEDKNIADFIGNTFKYWYMEANTFKTQKTKPLVVEEKRHRRTKEEIEHDLEEEALKNRIEATKTKRHRRTKKEMEYDREREAKTSNKRLGVSSKTTGKSVNMLDMHGPAKRRGRPSKAR